MYIYFHTLNSVLTCERYPQLFSVEYVKLNNLEDMCNKWEKNDEEDGKFTLSFKYFIKECDCDKSEYKDDIDFNDYFCYNCGIHKKELLNVGEEYYLQNSGNFSIVCVDNTKPNWCSLCKVENYPNMYMWGNDDKLCILHIDEKDGYLSDENIVGKIDDIKNYCEILFIDDIHTTQLW